MSQFHGFGSGCGKFPPAGAGPQKPANLRAAPSNPPRQNRRREARGIAPVASRRCAGIAAGVSARKAQAATIRKETCRFVAPGHPAPGPVAPHLQTRLCGVAGRRAARSAHRVKPSPPAPRRAIGGNPTRNHRTRLRSEPPPSSVAALKERIVSQPWVRLRSCASGSTDEPAKSLASFGPTSIAKPEPANLPEKPERPNATLTPFPSPCPANSRTRRQIHAPDGPGRGSERLFDFPGAMA